MLVFVYIFSVYIRNINYGSLCALRRKRGWEGSIGDGGHGGGSLTFLIKKVSKFQIFKKSGRVGKDNILQIFLNEVEDLVSVSFWVFSEKPFIRYGYRLYYY